MVSEWIPGPQSPALDQKEHSISTETRGMVSIERSTRPPPWSKLKKKCMEFTASAVCLLAVFPGRTSLTHSGLTSHIISLTLTSHTTSSSRNQFPHCHSCTRYLCIAP